MSDDFISVDRIAPSVSLQYCTSDANIVVLTYMYSHNLRLADSWLAHTSVCRRLLLAPVTLSFKPISPFDVWRYICNAPFSSVVKSLH